MNYLAEWGKGIFNQISAATQLTNSKSQNLKHAIIHLAEALLSELTDVSAAEKAELMRVLTQKYLAPAATKDLKITQKLAEFAKQENVNAQRAWVYSELFKTGRKYLDLKNEYFSLEFPQLKEKFNLLSQLEDKLYEVSREMHLEKQAGYSLKQNIPG